jgi:hypothetical protein
MPFPDSDALPITRRRCRRTRKEPVTQAERDAIQWKAIKAEFNWSNDERAETWVPWVRVDLVREMVDNDLRLLSANYEVSPVAIGKPKRAEKVS